MATNARAETIATAASFKGAFAKRRCLVPVDGYYEWRKVGRAKQPYAIGMADREPFTLPGLWENWRDRDTGEWVRTFIIVTTETSELVARLHDRMPVVIAQEDRERWLSDPDPSDLLKPYPANLMTMWLVSRNVNSPQNDRVDLLERVDDLPPSEPAGGIEPANSPRRISRRSTRLSRPAHIPSGQTGLGSKEHASSRRTGR